MTHFSLYLSLLVFERRLKIFARLVTVNTTIQWSIGTSTKKNIRSHYPLINTSEDWWSSSPSQVYPDRMTHLYDLVSNHYFPANVSVGVFFNVADVNGHVRLVTTAAQQQAEFSFTFVQYNLLEKKAGKCTWEFTLPFINYLYFFKTYMEMYQR